MNRGSSPRCQLLPVGQVSTLGPACAQANRLQCLLVPEVPRDHASLRYRKVLEPSLSHQLLLGCLDSNLVVRIESYQSSRRLEVDRGDLCGGRLPEAEDVTRRRWYDYLQPTPSDLRLIEEGIESLLLEVRADLVSVLIERGRCIRADLAEELDSHRCPGRRSVSRDQGVNRREGGLIVLTHLTSQQGVLPLVRRLPSPGLTPPDGSRFAATPSLHI